MKVREAQIPELIKQGRDREVIPQIYKKVLPLVEKYVLRRGGRKEDAYDVFQDALMVFYKQIIKGSFNPKYKVYGYVFRLSINYWINKIKKDHRNILKEDMTEHDTGEENTGPEILITEKNENILKSMFSNIGDKCVELLTYTIYYNLLLEDIMIRMDFPSVNAVKMQQQRCKKKLINLIEENPALADKLKE